MGIPAPACRPGCARGRTRRAHPRAHTATTLVELVEESWVVGTPTRRFFDDLLLADGLTPPTKICATITLSLAEQMVRESNAGAC